MIMTGTVVGAGKGALPEDVKNKYHLGTVTVPTVSNLEELQRAKRTMVAMGAQEFKRIFYSSVDRRYGALEICRKTDGNLEPMFWLLHLNQQPYKISD